MQPDQKKAEERDPHLHDKSTGTRHGVPAGAAQEKGTAFPNDDRQNTETAPLHPDAEKAKGNDI